MEPFIVNYGSNIWVDDKQSFSKVWGFRKETNDTISYYDSSKMYDVSTRSKYRFHWLIDSNGFLFRFEEIEIKNRIGKWVGRQRVVARLLPPEEISKKGLLKLLERVKEDEEYHDKSCLVATLEGLHLNDLVSDREILAFINSDPPNKD